MMIDNSPFGGERMLLVGSIIRTRASVWASMDRGTPTAILIAVEMGIEGRADEGMKLMSLSIRIGSKAEGQDDEESAPGCT